MEALWAFIAKYWLGFVLAAMGAGVTALWHKIKATYKLGKQIQDQEVFDNFKTDIQNTLNGFKDDVVKTIEGKEDNMLKIIKGKEKKFEKAIQNDEKLIGSEIDSLNEKHQQHQEILENSRKVSQQYRDLYQKGLLYILKRSYFEDCEKLLDPNHVITYDEFTSISEDHALYKEFGGNGRGDENFELIKSKYHEQTL